MSLRVGVDVGGTFTKAVAVSPSPLELVARAVVATTHADAAGVSAGVAAALADLLEQLGDRARDVEFVAFSTTQAMNALLEGDVARVGVVGIGQAPDLRPARKRTAVGAVGLAPGRSLQTEHAFLDATRGLTAEAVDAALDTLTAAGCTAVAASGAFAVDAPEHERLIADRARERGLPTCAGHELSSAYGLELRTVSAAINASILPLMERTAGVVEDVLARAGIDVPLLVLRGDGGAMALEAFRRTPSLSIGAGPAAGVAAALHQLKLTEGVVLECGGTSSNVSVVHGGRAAVRGLRVMGQPTAMRSVDSWVVGAAGGSMARLKRSKVAETGPRSAHVAGLPYACFAPDGTRFDAVELIAPRAGDPQAYAAVRGSDGVLYALTATCAARALDGDATARAAFGPLKAGPEALLAGAVDKIAGAVDEAARAYKLGPEVPIVALGGAGTALAGHVAARLGRPLIVPDHPEVLSSIGAALSLVRAESVRPAGDAATALREAERACVAAGAAADTVRVESGYDVRENVIRAVATGAVALESGAAGRSAIDAAQQRALAARTLKLDEDGLLEVAASDFYRVFCQNGSGPVAVVDSLGSVPLAEDARSVVRGEGDAFLDQLRA